MKKLIIFFAVLFLGITVGCGQEDAAKPLPPVPSSPNQSDQSVQNYPTLNEPPAQDAALKRAQDFLDQVSAQTPGTWSAPEQTKIGWQSEDGVNAIDLDGLKIKAEELDQGEISVIEEFFERYQPVEATLGERGNIFSYLIEDDFVCSVQEIPNNLEEGEEESVAVEFVLEVACGVLP